MLSGTWFGLDWGKMQIADFARIKKWKNNETYINKTNLLDGQEMQGLGILDIIGKRMSCPFFLGGGVPKALQTALGL